jgi:hypothetical protein
MQTKGIKNMFNKIKEENFPNFERQPFRYRRLLRPNRQDQKKRTTPRCSIIKTLCVQNKERILKIVREVTSRI